MQKFRKWIYSLCILTGLLAVCTACGKADSQPKEETTEVVTDGPVSGPEDFKRLGMIIDVASSNMVKDVSYEIKNKEIACINLFITELIVSSLRLRYTVILIWQG